MKQGAPLAQRKSNVVVDEALGEDEEEEEGLEASREG
jgi:hypothetical protein